MTTMIATILFALAGIIWICGHAIWPDETATLPAIVNDGSEWAIKKRVEIRRANEWRGHTNFAAASIAAVGVLSLLFMNAPLN